MPSVACSSLAIERIRDPAGQSACEAAKARGRSEAVAPVARRPSAPDWAGPSPPPYNYIRAQGSLASLAPGFISAALLLGCHRPSVVLVSSIVQAGKWRAAAQQKQKRSAVQCQGCQMREVQGRFRRRMRNFPLALRACASERNREGKKADLDAQWVTTTDRRMVKLN